MLRRNDDSVLRVALNFEVSGKRKQGRLKKTWNKQVKEETEKIGLKKEDALNCTKWSNRVQTIAIRMGLIWPSQLRGQHQKKLNNH